MNQPLISIVVPTFNKSKLLTETMDSIISQTYTNWECLIVDDGSTENNVQIAKLYESKDKRFKVYERAKLSQNKGANVCRNIGIKHSIGKYMMFLDGDDLLFPYCLEERLRAFNEDSSYDFIVFQMATGENLSILRNKKLTKEKTNYLYAFLSHDVPWAISAVLIKKELVTNDYLFDEKFPRIQDPEFYTKLLLKQDIKFKVLTDIKEDALYRHEPDRKTNYLNGVIGFRLYIMKFYYLTKHRQDAELCMDAITRCYKFATSHYYLKRIPKKTNFQEKSVMLNLTWFMFQKKLINYKDFLAFSFKILRF